MVLLQGMDDAVVDLLPGNEGRDAAVSADPVDRVKVVIMPVGHVFPGFDILAQGRMQPCAFQVMGRQGVAGQHGVDITGIDYSGKGFAGAAVKREGRAHDPHDFPVFLFMPEQVTEFDIVTRKRCFPAAGLAEHEDLLVFFRGPEAVRMNIDAFTAVFRAAADHQVTGLEMTELPDMDLPALIYRDTVHAAFLRQQPLSVNPEVFRIDAHGMVIVRGNCIIFHRPQYGVRAGSEF